MLSQGSKHFNHWSRGVELRVTLWGDVGRRFDEFVFQTMSSPVIVAFAGFVFQNFQASIWYFNPSIPKTLACSHYYSQIPVDIHQLPPSQNSMTYIQGQENENQCTIAELL